MRAAMITSMRNEGPFILEWLAYHRAIGFTDFLVFTNDCEDGTDTLLDALAAHNLLVHVPNPRRGKKAVQWHALERAADHDLLKVADWVMVADVDEFVNIHAGQGHLQDLIDAAEGAEGIAIPWRIFGSAGVRRFQDAPVIAQFDRAAPDQMLWPWRVVQYKSLCRMHQGVKLGVHRPKGQLNGHWVDGNGAPMPQTALRGAPLVMTDQPRYGLVQLNHYPLCSAESFLVKRARGKPNHMMQDIDLAYWVDRNLNTVEDRSILRHLPRVEAQMAEWLQDEAIKAAHQRAVGWRRAKIADVLATDADALLLFSRCLQAGTSEVLPLTQQRALLQARQAIARVEQGGASSA